MMLAVDGSISCLTGWFLLCKDSDSTLAAFQSYYAESEHHIGKKLWIVRIDAGPEWLNSDWIIYCNTSKIYMNVAVLYTHTQNSLAE